VCVHECHGFAVFVNEWVLVGDLVDFNHLIFGLTLIDRLPGNFCMYIFFVYLNSLICVSCRYDNLWSVRIAVFRFFIQTHKIGNFFFLIFFFGFCTVFGLVFYSAAFGFLHCIYFWLLVVVSVFSFDSDCFDCDSVVSFSIYSRYSAPIQNVA